MYIKQNSYQMLKMDDMDEKEMVIESESTRISEVINKKIYLIEQEKIVQEYSVNNITIEKLNEMLNKVLAEEKLEVKTINQKCKEITTKLSLQYNDWLENFNRKIGKRLMRN